jgi:hypothetical protein
MTTESLFCTVVIAGSGGAFVVIGLLMETLAERDFFKSIKQIHRLKRIRHWGERLVIGGVAVEVVLAGATAFSEWRKDPLKKPIAYASARVRVIIKTGSNMTPLFVNPDQTNFGWGAWMRFSSGSNVLLQLTADRLSMWNMGTTNERACRMEFREDALDFVNEDINRLKTSVKQFDGIDSLILKMPDMETNAEVVSGTVLLTVNDFTWKLDIPREISKWGLITMQKTNRAGSTEAQVLRVPVSDWAYPPRFTNSWYDGK